MPVFSDARPDLNSPMMSYEHKDRKMPLEQHSEFGQGNAQKQGTVINYATE